jgi:seryl-tRNA synthetase
MIDIKILRTEPELVRQSQAIRGSDVSVVDKAVQADNQSRKALLEFETLRAEQNAHSKLVSTAPKEEKAALVAAAQDLADKVKTASDIAGQAAEELYKIIWKIENVVLECVPAGG